MRVQLVLGPTTEPVDISEVKDHLRVEISEDEELIRDLITTAREYVEDITRRALITQTWDYWLDEWPACDSIRLPFGNLQSVTTVSWKDSEGVETILTAGTDYIAEMNGEACGEIVLPYATPWPSGTLYPSNPIRTRFICGWTGADTVPFKIKTAVKMAVAKLYESRGEDTVGVSVHEDDTIQRLLASARLREEF